VTWWPPHVTYLNASARRVEHGYPICFPLRRLVQKLCEYGSYVKRKILTITLTIESRSTDFVCTMLFEPGSIWLWPAGQVRTLISVLGSRVVCAMENWTEIKVPTWPYSQKSQPCSRAGSRFDYSNTYHYGN